jgi:hypothetical protein
LTPVGLAVKAETVVVAEGPGDDVDVAVRTICDVDVAVPDVDEVAVGVGVFAV